VARFLEAAIHARELEANLRAMPTSPDNGEIILESGTQTAEELQSTAEQIAERGVARQPASDGEGNEREASQSQDGKESGKPRITRDYRKDGVPIGVQKHFDKLTAKRREAEERAERAERRLAELEGRSPERQREAANDGRQEQPQEAERPGEAPHDQETAAEQFEGETEEQYGKRFHEKVIPAFSAQLKEAIKKEPDFQKLSKDLEASKVAIPEIAGFALPGLQNGTDVFLYLARNPQLCQRLNQLQGERQKMSKFEWERRQRTVLDAVYRISASLEYGSLSGFDRTSAPAAPRTPSVSRAPAPITPVNGGGSSAPKDLAELARTSPDEYIRLRNKQEAQAMRRGGRLR
jgi:hypothetical protein